MWFTSTFINTNTQKQKTTKAYSRARKLKQKSPPNDIKGSLISLAKSSACHPRLSVPGTVNPAEGKTQNTHSDPNWIHRKIIMYLHAGLRDKVRHTETF